MRLRRIRSLPPSFPRPACQDEHALHPSGRDNGDITIPREPTQRTTRPQCIPAPLSTGGRRAGGSMRQAQGNPVTDPLDDLHQNDEHQNDGDEHAGFVTVVAVLNGHITDAAGTDRPDHSR